MSSTSQCWPNPWILSSLERESLLTEPINSDYEDGYLKVKKNSNKLSNNKHIEKL